MNIFSRLFNKSPTNVDTSEKVFLLGSSQLDTFKLSNYTPDVDKILAKKGYSLYTQDMMSDDEVKACILIKKLGVTVGGWEVNPAVGESEEGYEEAKEIAEFTLYCLRQMKGSVEKLLKNISNAIVPGFSICEIVWEVIKEGKYAGKIGIKEIKSKPVENITFDMDEYGNINNIIQTIEGKQHIISVDKVLLYTYDPQNTGLPFGTSDLRAAYKHYWSKDALMRYRNVAAEKYSCPTVVGTYPNSFNKKMQQKLLNMCISYSIRSALIKPEGSTIELIEPKGSVMMPYDSCIENCNKGIARGIFGQILATDEGKSGGSYAQAKIHKGILGMFLTDIRKEIAEEVISEQLFKRLVYYNFGVTNLIPNMVLAAPDEKDVEQYGKLISDYIDRDVVDPNEPFARSMVGLPPKPEKLIKESRKRREVKDKAVKNGALENQNQKQQQQQQPTVTENNGEVNKTGGE